jgi:hypothetical protein
MPIQSRQGRIRAGDQITEAEMEAVRELNAARRVGRRRARVLIELAYIPC